MANNFCSNCGEPVSESGANVCTNCGKPLRQPQTESTPNENYQHTTGGSFSQSGSSNAQQTGSSDAQQTGSSNAQQAWNDTEEQTWSDNSQQTWRDNSQDAGSGQQNRSENKNTYTRPGNTTYVNDVNPLIPVLLSFFFPGSGQVYNGNMKKGLIIAASAIITLLIFPLISFIIWIYNLYDAYTESDKMRKGELPYAKATQNDVLYYIATFIGSFIVGFILVTIFALIFSFIFMF